MFCDGISPFMNLICVVLMLSNNEQIILNYVGLKTEMV
jgi:hypothetical protein